MVTQEQIHEKGFDMRGSFQTDYSKIKIGVKSLEDAILNLGTLKKGEIAYTDKAKILKAIAENDLETIRNISNYYLRVSGIYQRACNYLAALYRYDWYIVPEIKDKDASETKILKEFSSLLNYLDNSYIKQACGEWALSTVVNGAYYGYIVPNGKRLIVQELPVNYCRSRYSVAGTPAVEFNMRFFDDKFTDINYRMRVLKLFPEEFQKGYILYKQKKLPSDYVGEYGSWYLLSTSSAFKFNFYQNDLPVFIDTIPALIDLDAAQDLDRRKQMQKLLKIIVQKLPRDKNGDLIFDVDEARDIHNNGVQMLSKAIGVDVLTTFTDVESIDLSDRNTTTTTDDLSKVERTVYNSMGISQNLFNADGNLSMNNSVLNDESAIRRLLLQFGAFFDKVVASISGTNKKYSFKFYMLETTQYNYKDLSKMYKEQVQIGYSKMLPQIALGHSQSSIINTAFFENKVLHLNEIMVPPLQSSVMNAETLQTIGEESESGRPELAENEKSDKTLQNEESKS